MKFCEVASTMVFTYDKIMISYMCHFFHFLFFRFLYILTAVKSKVQEMQNLSKYFFSIICIWLDRACKTVQENIIQNVF